DRGACTARDGTARAASGVAARPTTKRAARPSRVRLTVRLARLAVDLARGGGAGSLSGISPLRRIPDGSAKWHLGQAASLPLGASGSTVSALCRASSLLPAAIHSAAK